MDDETFDDDTIDEFLWNEANAHAIAERDWLNELAWRYLHASYFIYLFDMAETDFAL